VRGNQVKCSKCEAFMRILCVWISLKKEFAKRPIGKVSVASGYYCPDFKSLSIEQKHRDYKVPMQQRGLLERFKPFPKS